MADLIYQITVKDSSAGTEKTYDVCLPKAIAQLFSLSGNDGTNLTVSSLKHMNFEPKPYSSSGGAGGDIQFKAGGCVKFMSHHQEDSKEVMCKILNGDEKAIRWRVNTPELIFTQKNALDDNGEANTNEFNLRFYRGVVDSKSAATRSNPFHSYLKVRARAIDLRCEEHGGIALQPKGTDSSGYMNKIKFEHGGGDGLEFGTFNSEKTSIFTDEYRFNKDGVWKMAVRETEISDKKVEADTTTHFKYKKNNSTKDGYEEADDFYDYIKLGDPQTTTKDIIKTANALNTTRGIHTKITDAGSLEIKTFDTWHWEYVAADVTGVPEDHVLATEGEGAAECISKLPSRAGLVAGWYSKSDFDGPLYTDNDTYGIGGKSYRWKHVESPKVKLESDTDLEFTAADDIQLEAADGVKLDGAGIRLNAPVSGINFGTTESLVFLAKKFTKGCNVEASTTPVSFKLGTLNNNRKTVVYDPTTEKFKFPVDVLYTTADHTTLWDPTNTSLEIPLYFSDGTQVEKGTKYFVMKEGDIYRVETKSGSGITTKKAAILVATGANSGGTYTRVVETAASGDTPAVYYYPDTVFVAPDYVAVSGEQTLTAGEVASSSTDSFTLSDLAALVAYAKEQTWIS